MSTFDADLTPVLALATDKDLDFLVDYIKSAELSEMLTINDLYTEHTPNHTKYVTLIEKEIKEFGGNSFINLFRGGGPSYKEIVCDVADKLSANYNKNSSIEDVENAIIIRITSEAWEKMTNDEKVAFLKEMGLSVTGSLPKALPVIALQAAIRSSGFLAYRLVVIVANAIARQLLGRGLTFATNAALTRSLSIFAGPIGWVITGVWTLLDLAGPAYRVTIPCVVHIAMLRQQFKIEHCLNCSAPYAIGAKFCQECGEKLD